MLDAWPAVIAVVLGMVAIDRLGLAAARRGWVRWRGSPPSRASASTAMLSVQALFEPDRQHVVEQRRHDEADIELVGDRDPLDDGPGARA